jgi:tetratricopeptide (TPR) repeat protein
MGQYEKAITHGEQSEVIFEDLGNLYNLMCCVKVLEKCLKLLGNYAQAIKHHAKYWDLSQQQGNTHQAQAALNMGVTLWTQGLAEHHATRAAAQTVDGGLQKQKLIRRGQQLAHISSALQSIFDSCSRHNPESVVCPFLHGPGGRGSEASARKASCITASLLWRRVSGRSGRKCCLRYV